VAEELRIAPQREIPIIPVPLDGTPMARRDELPYALADLANRHAERIAHESFAADSGRSIGTLDRLATSATPAQSASPLRQATLAKPVQSTSPRQPMQTQKRRQRWSPT
jgi:hypothetical protein